MDEPHQSSNTCRLAWPLYCNTQAQSIWVSAHSNNSITFAIKYAGYASVLQQDFHLHWLWSIGFCIGMYVIFDAFLPFGRNEVLVKHVAAVGSFKCSHCPKWERVTESSSWVSGGGVNWGRLEPFVRAHPLPIFWHLSELHREITGHSKDRWWDQPALGYSILTHTQIHTHGSAHVQEEMTLWGLACQICTALQVKWSGSHTM